MNHKTCQGCFFYDPKAYMCFRTLGCINSRFMFDTGCTKFVDRDDVNLTYGQLNSYELISKLIDSSDKIKDFKQKLADKDNDNDKLLDDFGKAAKEVEEKRAKIIELSDKVAELEARLCEKDEIINDVMEQIDIKNNIIRTLNNELTLYRPEKFTVEDLYPRTFVPSEHELWPKKNPWIKQDSTNSDCPAYAARMKAKYDSLVKAGFTEDQAMSMLPLWWDERG